VPPRNHRNRKGSGQGTAQGQAAEVGSCDSHRMLTVRQLRQLLVIPEFERLGVGQLE
jgi:hypothetical protein